MLHEIIEPLKGRVVARIRRAYFLFNEEIDSDRGPLEITFDSDEIILLDTNSDWSVRAEATPWSDPFEGNLTAENIEFIRTHGRWAAYDESHSEPYSGIIGTSFDGGACRFNEVGELSGLKLDFTTVSVETESVSGELNVQVRQREHPNTAAHDVV